MYLVVNLGLKSIRGIIFDRDGEQLYSTSHPVHTVLFHDQVEQDPEEWIKLLEQILESIRENTDLASSVTHITVTTSSSCILAVDESGQPVTPVMMVSDKRADDISTEISEDPVFVAANEKHPVTCAASSLIPKAVWYRRNRPEKAEKVRRWLGAGEFLNHWFTGRYVTDPLNAGKSFYTGGEYHGELLDHVGIDVDKLPEVVEIGSTMEVLKPVRSRYRFADDCTFVVSTYDAICAVLGSSTGEPNNACDVSGTVTSVRVLHDERPENDSSILLTQSLESMDRCLIGASNNLGGGIIEWYKQAFFDDEDPEVYVKMESSAAKAKPGADGVLFLPYLLGERAPFVDPKASASFFGIRRNTTIHQFSRAVFESTAFVTRDLVELIRTSGIEVSSLTVSGGLSRFDLVNQIKADVCNVPVYVVENFESTSKGAFIIMSLATGVFEDLDEALAETVTIRKVIRPSKRRHAMYDEMFRLYKNLNGSLTDIYEQHTELNSRQAVHQNEIVRNL